VEPEQNTGEIDDADYLNMAEADVLGRLDHKLTIEDKYLLSIVEPDRRAAMFARLEALASLGAGEIDVEEASRRAGVSVPTFYRLKKAWTEKTDRGLRSVAGAVGRNPRGASRRGVREEARRHAVDLLKNEALSDLPVKTLARLVRKATKESVSIEVAEGIVRSVRLERSRSMTGKETGFGRDLVLDVCAVSMKIIDDEKPIPRQALLATVMEASTGLILAAELCTERNAVQAQAQAIGYTIAFLRWKGLDVWGQEPTRLTAVVGPSGDPIYSHFVEVLSNGIGYENVKAEGPRRYGRSTIAVIGRRLGRLTFIPASTESGDGLGAGRAAKRPYTFAEAAAIVAQSVHEHDQPIIDLLRKQKLLGSGSGEHSSKGRMTEALKQAMPISRFAFRGAPPMMKFKR